MEFQRTAQLNVPFAEAVTRTREALGAHGFGILTEIDMQATLLAKRGTQIEPYIILGACNRPWPRVRSPPTLGSACCCRAASWCGQPGPTRARSTSSTPISSPLSPATRR